jgi:hypothetical protein
MNRHARHPRRALLSDREGIGQRLDMGTGAALEALQKMGMAPSDAEIAEAAKKVQAQEVEEK